MAALGTSMCRSIAWWMAESILQLGVLRKALVLMAKGFRV